MSCSAHWSPFLTENSSAYAFWVETAFGSFTACQISKECPESFGWTHFGGGSFGLFFQSVFHPGSQPMASATAVLGTV